MCVFDCGPRSMQMPRSQPAQSTGCAHISSAACAVSNPRVRGSPPVAACYSCAVPEIFGSRAWNLGLAVRFSAKVAEDVVTFLKDGHPASAKRSLVLSEIARPRLSGNRWRKFPISNRAGCSCGRDRRVLRRLRRSSAVVATSRAGRRSS